MDSTTIENDLSLFCKEHYLSKYCFEEIKEVIMKYRITIDERYATAWYMRFEFLSVNQIPSFIKQEYPNIYKLIRHGDVLINTTMAQSDRFEIFFVNKVKSFWLMDPEKRYGHSMIPKLFSKQVGDFNIDYWSKVNNNIISGDSYDFESVSWDYDFEYVPVPDSLKKRTQPITDSLYSLYS